MSNVATLSGIFRNVNPRTASFCLALVAALSLAGGLAGASRSLGVARSVSAASLVTRGGDRAPALGDRSAHKLTRSQVRATANLSRPPCEAASAAA
jgi:hypothetical protein